MKTMAKSLEKSLMGPLHHRVGWTRRAALLLYVAMELIAVYSPTALGALELQLDEEQPAGTVVGDISTGLPPGVTASLYFISDHQGTGVGSDLDIDESTGVIKTAKALDRELRDRYNFIAVTMTGVTVEVNVRVNDINDHAPTFPKKTSAFKIPEQTAVATRFPLEPAVDADKGQLATQGYLITDGNVGRAFTLETRRGSNEVLYLDLVVNAILDREKRSTYTLSLEAFDGGTPRRSDQMTLAITVQDINDNAPVFNQSRYHAIISESLAPGRSILQVLATDADDGDNGLVLYEINRRQSDPDRYFVIDRRTGTIALNKPLDFETRRVHELVVQARDNASQPEVTNAFVTVHVRDYNDNQPTMTIIFLSEDGSPRISEGAQPGQYVARISVTDPDYGEYANVNVSLEGGDGKFALTTKDSIIYLMCVDQILDREERDAYQLRVMATDSGTPPLRAESSFTIRVTDVNDNPPLFDQPVYQQVIPEVVFPGSFVLQVTARDKDQGPNGDVSYSILQERGSQWDWFSIDAVTGIITTLARLDYENDPRPRVTVVATDGGKPPLSSTAVVNVVLQDVNDNEPLFQRNFYNVSIMEDTAAGTCILQVTATDADGGSFGSVTYSLGSGINAPASPLHFIIDKETGQVCTSAALDRDQGAGSYDFTVTAVDGGGLSSVAYVKVDLVDVNDNRPTFYPVTYAVSLSTQSAPGTSVVRVMAFDPDTGENGRVTYQTVPGGASPYFTLNKDTGVISLSRSLHGNTNSIIPLVVSAQDGGGLVAPVNARVNISVMAGAVAPPVFEQTQYSFTVSEDVSRGTVVGVVRAASKTGYPKDVSYTISSGDPVGYFMVDPETGALRTSLPLDHESQPSLDLELQARSGDPPAYGRTHVRITVADVNDNAPVFLPSFSESLLLPERTEPGAVVYHVQAEDPDSGANGRLTFDLSSTAQKTFSLERSTGEIRLVGLLSYEATPRYDLRVTARDGGAPQRSATLALAVHVQAVNQQGPAFDALTYRVELREGTPLNTRFLQVRARDRDSGPPLTYHLRPDGDAAGFGVAADSGWLFVRSALDREAKELYLVTVVASAPHGQLKKTGSATVRISVTDENDNAPRLPQNTLFLAVRENLLAGTGFGRVPATDRDGGPNGRLSYSFLHADRHFQINSQTGEISTRKALDREQQSGHQVLVLVQDGGSPPRSATGTAFVSVLDDNDNAPAFSHCQAGKGLVMQVLEGQSPGVLIGTLQARDPDEGENGTVSYSLSGPRAERFTLNANNGELRSSSPLSHSEREEYALMVTAEDKGLPSHRSSCSLSVQVVSSTQSAPSRTGSRSVSLHLTEDAEPGSVIGSVRDAGAEPGGVTYMVVGSGDSARDGTLVVDRLTGDVLLARPLDYERDARYVLQVQVDAPPSSTLVRLSVEVEDDNDHAPRFPEDPVAMVISEGAAAGSLVYTFRADDADGGGPNSQLRYSVLRQWPDTPGLLTLDPTTGVLSLGRQLDREAAASFVLVVQATDSAPDVGRQRRGSVTARIYVTDENDNSPAFGSPAAVAVTEDQPVGYVALYAVARDADAGENGRVTYSVRAGNEAGIFSLNPSTGSLSISKPLDREQQDTFNLTIVAEDHGMPRRSSSQLLRVHVIDVNDEAPWFEQSQYEASIAENQPPGSSVLTVSASDLDQGSNGQVTYGGISEEAFSINPVTGVITTTKALDRELREHYTVTVYAKDGGLPPNYAKATVSIGVLDKNDNAPVFGRLFYSIEVPENLEALSLLTLRATDPDVGDSGKLNYKITAGDPSGDFRIDRQSGVLSTSRPLDRERMSSYTLTVTVLDRGGPPLGGTATVEVTVLDVNDNGPQFQGGDDGGEYTADVSEGVAVGSFVLAVRAVDPDLATNGQVRYHLCGGGSRGAFVVDLDTGRIITAAPLDREKTPAYYFHVCATDSSPGEPRNSTARVTVYVQDVNDNAPFFVHDPLVVNVSVAGGSSGHRGALATMRAEDKDFGANGSVFYRFSGPARGFAINSLTGDIQATEGLKQSQRVLTVDAVDQGSPAQTSTGVVVVYVREQPYRGIRFSRNTKDVSLQENAAKGTAVTQTQAQYPDGSRTGITYSIFSGNRMQSFAISSTTGEIWVQKSEGLDFEETPRLRLVVKAETVTFSTYMAVNIILQDVNDNLPRFQLQNYVAYIREAQGYDSPIVQVVADDLDQGQNGQVTYSIRSSAMSGLFKIDPQTGSVTTAAIMDREIWTQTKLVVTATDRGTPRLAGSATLTVIIIDLNDNSPTIPLPQAMRVPEDTLIGTVVTMVTGNDVDSGPALSYTLHAVDAACQGVFGVHRYGGALILTASLDYESRTWYTLTVRTSDSQHWSEANVTLLVEDVNDNAPAFTQHLYQVTVSEHLPAGSSIVTVTATDQDSGENGKVTYRVMSSTSNMFYINSDNGTLFVGRETEFDPRSPSMVVVIEARDHGSPPLSSLTTVQVQVSDANDHAPVFHQSEYSATVSEDDPPGSTVLTLEAADEDPSRDNRGFDFAIASGNTGESFQVESSVRFVAGRGFQTVGILVLAGRLDFEAVRSYNLTVSVADRGVPRRGSSAHVLVRVADANDNPPAFGRTEYTVAVAADAGTGTEVLQLSATDPDSAPHGEVQYCVSSGNDTGLFHLDRWTGVLRLTRALGGEDQNTHSVVVGATDGGGGYALAKVIVEVRDANNNKPYFPLRVLTASIGENQPQGSLVTVLHALDGDRGALGQLHYHVLDGGDSSAAAFVVNRTSGEVRTRTPLDLERCSGALGFTAVAVDGGNLSATVTVSVHLTGEDEYDPVFALAGLSFSVPEGSEKGRSIGRVQARDEDAGADGIVLYALDDDADGSQYFHVERSTGVVSLAVDSQGRGGGRAKRVLTLRVTARGPLETSRRAVARVTVDVSHTSLGLAADAHLLLAGVTAVSLGAGAVLIAMGAALFFVRLRRRQKAREARSRTQPPSPQAMHKLEESKLAGKEMIYHQATLPGYAVQGPYATAATRGGSLDPSHSSGRGSAEAAEDDEIRMINEYPRVSSISSSMQERLSARGPDSGIQQDADQLSDVSCDPSVDGAPWFKGRKGTGSLNGSLPAGQATIYRDEVGGGGGGAYLGVGRGLNIAHPKDYTFPADGKPAAGGSLAAMVAGDEELRGSYNWDYLLDWCPQFQPLASVFTEIARLKDETVADPRRPFSHRARPEVPRIDPPPLITSVAHPGAKTVPPKPPAAAGRTSFPRRASFRRSPLSSDGSISSAAMSPSFSPSLSPLAARSPAVTPFSVSQGPSASMISTTDHNLEHSQDADIRI